MLILKNIIITSINKLSLLQRNILNLLTERVSLDDLISLFLIIFSHFQRKKTISLDSFPLGLILEIKAIDSLFDRVFYIKVLITLNISISHIVEL